jgi:hypothetical protein
MIATPARLPSNWADPVAPDPGPVVTLRDEISARALDPALAFLSNDERQIGVNFYENSPFLMRTYRATL